MNKNDLFFAKVRDDAVIPTKNTEDAGYDVYACIDDFLVIPGHQTKLIPTGIASAMHPSKYIQIEERGSTGSKGIKKSAGVIDSSFRGEWFVAITNSNDYPLIIATQTQREFEERAKLNEYGDLYITDHDGKNVFLYYEDMDQNKSKCYIYYPAKKAIAQAVVHEVHNMNEKEIPYAELKQIASERGDGMLGSSNK